MSESQHFLERIPRSIKDMRNPYTELAGFVLIISLLTGFVLSNVVPAEKLGLESRSGQELYEEKITSAVSPIDVKLNDADQYRFGEYQGSIIYGPYLVNGEKFYYHNDNVLNERLRKVQNKEAESLHNFYLQTYLDPLFYSPTDGENFDLSGFEKFENQKILAEYCGLNYDLIPQEFFNEVERNHKVTESFLTHASRQNAMKLQSQNLNTTKAYSDYVSDFINLTNRDVSDNKCFNDDSINSGMAKATRTPVQYRIDSGTILNHSEMANNNVKELLKDVEERNDILSSEREFKLEVNSVTLENRSYVYENMMTPSEAKEEMNARRVSELTELSMMAEEHDEEEDSHTHEGSESSHTHGEETHTHEEENSQDSKTTATEKKLTLEQWNELRLVDEIPTKYDVEPICLEKDTVPIYGWDKNVYPNIILAQEGLYSMNPGYVKDFFSLSRCPYVEITRLNWYVNDGLYREIEDSNMSESYNGPNKSTVERAEQLYLENPGDETLSQLSSGYRMALVKSLEKGRYDSELPQLWKRTTQEKSKLHKFETTYDDFYSKEHMEVWDDYFANPGPNARQSVYNNFLLLESIYGLTFMTWSDSVWRLENKPEKFAGKIN